ncbi:A/G-specific adenine glycosylase [Azohydromonas caseinilytica]|uniref:Adenine DNA glycosylase n=1 Tax=Azohydromonas caseinilytica TaxID=2728836 RepID=A0A848F4U6_9BURK|nr:A/G-specific adenine glycosylase [Azohydromonas caseinilytica]NML13393.1 A/G-specific adenine glycosylase [Azohydromonas caseinilytica]
MRTEDFSGGEAAPSTLAERVIAWQRTHGRHALPWQNTRDPYRVWLSEIMLQQTQVATVLGYYERFLARFPDVAALAAAPLDEVLALWSGLGYYSRARNLHRCAQAVMSEHGGRFPDNSATLATLPGIGKSTAAAIAAFCFGERAAILDGNVKRVLTRALGFDRDLSQASAERELWAKAQALLPAAGIEAYTQGLMDLGAGVCTQRRPTCLLCPLQHGCVAHAQGDPARYPVKTRRVTRGRRSHALLWLQQGDRLWLTQRPDSGVWASLWSLPEYEDLEALQQRLTALPGQGEALPLVEHALTHFDWALQPWRHELPQDESARAAVEAFLPPGRWVTLAQAFDMGLPAPVRKLLERCGV